MDVLRTEAFDKRLREVADNRARTKITVCAQRMRKGNFGDSKFVGMGVFEARIHYGPGYRIYYTRRGLEVILLLLCGDKRTQQEDIWRAMLLARSP